MDDLNRLTSPLFWLGRLVGFVRWVVGTNRRRIIAGLSLLVAAIVGGIASGAAGALMEQLFKAT